MARTEAHCNIQGHVPGDLHSQQLTRKNEEIANLEAQVDALRADLAMYPHLDPQLADLLVYMAGSLRAGQEAGAPHPQAGPTDGASGTGKPQSKAPRGGDPRARRATDWLVASVTRVLDSFNHQKDNDWKRIQIGDSAIDIKDAS